MKHALLFITYVIAQSSLLIFVFVFVYYLDKTKIN